MPFASCLLVLSTTLIFAAAAAADADASIIIS